MQVSIEWVDPLPNQRTALDEVLVYGKKLEALWQIWKLEEKSPPAAPVKTSEKNEG